MISSNLMGGLGNYLFQIGAACTLARNNNDEAIFDFNTQLQAHRDIHDYTNNILRNIKTGPIYCTNKFTENKDFSYKEITYTTDLYLSGYFQSEKYLDRNYILNLFSADLISKQYMFNMYKDIIDSNNTVSVHVRRGNYLHKQNRHPVQNIDYYKNAFSYFTDATYVVFSNDIQWCKENFKGNNFIFIDENEQDYISLYLMSYCKHNIIANSSFSWWGAFLNENLNKQIIAPKQWFGPDLPLNTENIYSKSWIVL